MAEEDLDGLSALFDSARAADGHSPIGEHKWLDLVQGGRHGFAGFVARDLETDKIVGYAQLSLGPTPFSDAADLTDAAELTDATEPGQLRKSDASQGAAMLQKKNWGLECVVHPQHRDPSGGIAIDLVRAALLEVATSGGGHVHYWVPKPSPADEAVAAEAGMAKGRDLLQMRVGLPVAFANPKLDLRPFVPGEDEAEWLEVNARAFAGHPEQGGWNMETLLDREKEPWFDPEGFLLYHADGRLAASCWTKVHKDEDPPLGEIYVISVDPSYQGRGLGKALTLAGLERLYRAGLSSAMLYVDAGNLAATALYASLGFKVDHLDRAYVVDVAAQG